MKKINTDNVIENVRRQPFESGSLDHLQESSQEGFADIVNGLVDDEAGMICLKGCVDSDPDATDFNISAGVIFYQGELYRIDAFVGSHATNVPVLSIETDYAAIDPVTFDDGNEYSVHEIRKMKWTMAVSGSGLADFADLKRLKDLIKPNSINASGVVTAFKKFSWTGWNMDTTKSIQVDHDLPNHLKILGISGMILDNAGTTLFPIGSPDVYFGNQGTVTASSPSTSGIDDDQIRIERADGGRFDDALFNDASGWIIIHYEV